MLADLNEECDELSFLQDKDEPTTYSTAATNINWVKEIEIKLDAFKETKLGILLSYHPVTSQLD